MSFKDLIPWRRGHEVPVQRQEDARAGDPFADGFGLSPFFRDSTAPFFREARGLFDHFFDGFPGFGPAQRELGPALSLDFAERDDEYELSIELPGVDEQDVEISVADGALTVRGEKRSQHETRAGDVHRMERSYGRFERSLALPSDVDPERVSATFRKGVLHVTCPKLAEARTQRRKVPVRSISD